MQRNPVIVAMLFALIVVGNADGQSTSATISDNYPEQPIKVIVPFGAGGGSDTFVRILQKAIKENDLPEAQLAEQFDVHPNQITSWKAQLEGSAIDVFGSGGSATSAAPVVDVKSLHAKIGELALENDFLAKALGR